MNTLAKRLLSAICMMAFCICLAVAQTNTIKHTVDRGETLASIAKRYAITEAKLIELNPDAAQFVYVGMELIIPVVSTETATEQKQVYNNTDNLSNIVAYSPISNSDTNFSYNDSFEKNRKSSYFELGYSASTFEDVKSSGSYGFGWTSLPWTIADRIYMGLHFSPLGFNFGLVHSNYATAQIKLGPALGYYFTETVFVAMPINLLCVVSFDSNDNAKTTWGMQLSPSMHIGKKIGIYIGPQLTIGFYRGAEATFGFKTGIYI